MMRFRRLDRPMGDGNNEGDGNETPTRTVMQGWLKHLRSVRKDQLASPLTTPLWCLRRSVGLISSEKLQLQEHKLWAVICQRYATVFMEHADRLDLPSTEILLRGGRLTAGAYVLLRTAENIDEIPRVLWAQASSELGECQELKAKYFLRPFVDEITDTTARNAVLHHAFGMGPRPESSGTSGRELFNAGCWELHGLLTRHASFVNAWTDGSVSERILSRVKANPVGYFEYLLLPQSVARRQKRAA